jgi:hypothetical protein
MPDNSLQSLGRYTIHAELGRGGFATVYRATDTILERDVALKILKPGWTDDAKAVERFMREAKQASRLKHPNIVTIYDVGQAEGRLFIAMELVRGRSLQQIIAEDGALPWARMLAILEQSAAALDYAHAEGLVHRDIKPANIILDESKSGSAVQVMLTDFGLVRGAEQASLSMGTTGGLLGTPEYIPPEIWDGEPATKASDIYALGCVAFYLLTGKVLFSATTPMAVLKRHAEGPIFPQQWPSSVFAEAEAILRRALAKDPDQRQASAAEFVAELRGCEGQAVREQAAREREAKRQEEAERTAQALLAVEAARRAEEERAQQEAERKAKEEADRKSKDEADRKAREEQERQRQAELVAQAAVAEKAKQEAEERERQRQAREAAQLAEEEARRKQIEQQHQAAVDGSAVREARVVDRKRFLWLSVAGGVIGWGLGWFMALGLLYDAGPWSLIPLGIVAGLISSYAQWLALRHVASGWKWMVASIVGLSVGFGLGFSVAFRSSGLASLIIVGGTGGLGIGIGQWLVLRHNMSGVLWWLVANVGALALGLSIASGIVDSSPQGFESIGAIIILTLGCTLQSAVAGWLLPRLLKPVVE